ncbi:hypothetical protein ABPG75_013793 [Micractinium tetrahymenae]
MEIEAARGLGSAVRGAHNLNLLCCLYGPVARPSPCSNTLPLQAEAPGSSGSPALQGGSPPLPPATAPASPPAAASPLGPVAALAASLGSLALGSPAGSSLSNGSSATSSRHGSRPGSGRPLSLLSMPVGVLDKIAFLLPHKDRRSLAATRKELRAISSRWFKTINAVLHPGQEGAAVSLASRLERCPMPVSLFLIGEASAEGSLPDMTPVLSELTARPAATGCIDSLACSNVSLDSSCLPLLSSLDLLLVRPGCQLGGDAEHIWQLVQLQYLTLSCPAVAGSWVGISGLASLCELDLSDCTNAGSVLQALPAVSKLKALILQIPQDEFATLHASASDWSHLTALKTLTGLHLSSLDASGAAAAARQLPALSGSLQAIHLGARSFRDLACQLASCSALVTLSLHPTGRMKCIEAAYLLPISSLAELAQLRLRDYSCVGPEKLALVLAPLAALTSLELKVADDAELLTSAYHGWNCAWSGYSNLRSLRSLSCDVRTASCLSTLTSLTALTIIHVVRELLAEGLYALTQLRSLALAVCHLEKLPPQLSSLHQLSHLDAEAPGSSGSPAGRLPAARQAGSGSGRPAAAARQPGRPAATAPASPSTAASAAVAVAALAAGLSSLDLGRPAGSSGNGSSSAGSLPGSPGIPGSVRLSECAPTLLSMPGEVLGLIAALLPQKDR